MVGDHGLDVAQAVDPFDVGHPGGVGRAEAEDGHRVDLGLDEGLLHEDVIALGPLVADVGLELRRPHRVELVGEGEVGALHVDAHAAVAALDAREVVLVLLGGGVGIDADAELVGRVVGGLGRLRGRPLVGRQVVLEEVEVHGRLVLGHDRLAVGAAADQGDGGAHVVAGLPGVEFLRGVEDVDAAVLLDLLVIEARDLGVRGGGRRQRQGERQEPSLE